MYRRFENGPRRSQLHAVGGVRISERKYGITCSDSFSTGEEFYQITIGGRADENAQMGTLIGPAVPYGDVADVIEDIVEAYLALRDRPEELFVDTVKRLGVEPFKERVYATR